ncbi:MAG: hypothetical protein M0Z43_03375 [Acidithiobacillus sp.]|nr:hypothetical protein [Acidithiobacillus sp.]
MRCGLIHYLWSVARRLWNWSFTSGARELRDLTAYGVAGAVLCGSAAYLVLSHNTLDILAAAANGLLWGIIIGLKL